MRGDRRQIADERRESYRRIAVFLGTAVREKRFSTVLVSSATAGEGTTTTVVNVARHLRESCGLTPLLIELNHRSPRSRTLAIPGSGKMIDANAGEQRDAMEGIQQGPWGLSLIAAAPTNASDSGSRDVTTTLRRILDQVAERFDIVLVDTPPILESADTVMAGAVIPRLLLVVEAGRTRHEVLERAKSVLTGSNIAIVGTVLNKRRRFIPGWMYRWLIQ